MKRRMVIVALLTGFLSVGLAHPGSSSAGVSVNIAIPLPGLVIPAPPAMVVIPGTYAYAAPDVESGLFFYQGYWYRPYQGGWYSSVEFSGPWGRVAVGSVPPPIVAFSSYERRAPAGYERMPYPVVMNNWRRWEEERHWDNYERRGGRAMNGRGHGMGMGMGMGGR